MSVEPIAIIFDCIVKKGTNESRDSAQESFVDDVKVVSC